MRNTTVIDIPHIDHKLEKMIKSFKDKFKIEQTDIDQITEMTNFYDKDIIYFNKVYDVNHAYSKFVTMISESLDYHIPLDDNQIIQAFEAFIADPDNWSKTLLSYNGTQRFLENTIKNIDQSTTNIKKIKESFPNKFETYYRIFEKFINVYADYSIKNMEIIRNEYKTRDKFLNKKKVEYFCI